uniref:phosphonate ABC transporter, permease protein PhnE n=1 Tax=Actinotalea sp. C106 TaxID=2908644 RepID=UPI0020294DB2
PPSRRTPPGPTRPPSAPARWRRPDAVTFVALVAVVAFIVHGGMQGTLLGPEDVVSGTGRLGKFLGDAFPPSTERLPAILAALLVTVEMAVIGTVIGVILSVPLAVAAARNTSPNRIVYAVTRGFISVCRTIPDLIWGLIFVIAVGLGPKAGVLAIAVDVMGFCGRFFAESIEELDKGTVDGLRATGANERAVLGAGVLPACLPSFVATSMFALESSARSSVVLGLVGAGGIGIELSVSMTLLRYDEALAIILCIFVVVLGVERLSAHLRRRMIPAD